MLAVMSRVDRARVLPAQATLKFGHFFRSRKFYKSENKNPFSRSYVAESDPIPLKLGQNTRAHEPVPSHITSVQYRTDIWGSLVGRNFPPLHSEKLASILGGFGFV